MAQWQTKKRTRVQVGPGKYEIAEPGDWIHDGVDGYKAVRKGEAPEPEPQNQEETIGYVSDVDPED